MATTKRITRQDMKHDEFVDTMGRVSLWIEQNWQQAAAVVGGLVLLMIVGFAVTSWMSHSREAARQKVARATSLINAPVVESGANPSDPVAPTFPSRTARAQATLSALDAAQPSGAAHPLADYFRGVALLQLNRASDAESAFQSAVGGATDPMLKGLARHGVASAAALRGDLAGAAQKLRELADRPEGYPKDLALYELSRVQKQAGKAQDANQTLQQLAKEFPDSPLVEATRAVTPQPPAPQPQG